MRKLLKVSRTEQSDHVIQAQRSSQRRAVTRLTDCGGYSFGSVGNHSFLGPKLVIGKPNDRFEQEADRVADQVMRMPRGMLDSGIEVPALSNHGLQRKCSCGGAPGPSGECAECQKKRLTVQRRVANAQESGGVPPIVHEVLRSPGRPLDPATRAFMEPRFGHDFSHVRIHTGTHAAESAQAVGALAYTVGRNIVFDGDRYAQSSSKGHHLLAHELIHVLQQCGSPCHPSSHIQIGEPRNQFESKANAVPESLANAEAFASCLSLAPTSLQRKCTSAGWEFEYDGCSVPVALASVVAIDKDNPAGGIDTKFSNSVRGSAGTLACDKHDECYQTCNPSPGARAACDQGIHDHMKLICVQSSADFFTRAKCFKWAEIYYAALRVGGGSAFAARQTDVCSCKSPGKPTPTPTPTPLPTIVFPRSGRAKTTGSLLRLRTGPGLHFPALGELGERGTPVQVITQVHGDPVEGIDIWDQIPEGYIADRFVAFDTSP